MGVDASSIPTSPQGQLASAPWPTGRTKNMIFLIYDVKMQRENAIWEEICLKILSN